MVALTFTSAVGDVNTKRDRVLGDLSSLRDEITELQIAKIRDVLRGVPIMFSAKIPRVPVCRGVTIIVRPREDSAIFGIIRAKDSLLRVSLRGERDFA